MEEAEASQLRMWEAAGDEAREKQCRAQARAPGRQAAGAVAGRFLWLSPAILGRTDSHTARLGAPQGTQEHSNSVLWGDFQSGPRVAHPSVDVDGDGLYSSSTCIRTPQPVLPPKRCPFPFEPPLKADRKTLAHTSRPPVLPLRMEPCDIKGMLLSYPTTTNFYFLPTAWISAAPSELPRNALNLPPRLELWN